MFEHFLLDTTLVKECQSFFFFIRFPQLDLDKFTLFGFEVIEHFEEFLFSLLQVVFGILFFRLIDDFFRVFATIFYQALVEKKIRSDRLHKGDCLVALEVGSKWLEILSEVLRKFISLSWSFGSVVKPVKCFEKFIMLLDFFNLVFIDDISFLSFVVKAFE